MLDQQATQPTEQPKRYSAGLVAMFIYMAGLLLAIFMIFQILRVSTSLNNGESFEGIFFAGLGCIILVIAGISHIISIISIARHGKITLIAYKTFLIGWLILGLGQWLVIYKILPDDRTTMDIVLWGSMLLIETISFVLTAFMASVDKHRKLLFYLGCGVATVMAAAVTTGIVQLSTEKAIVQDNKLFSEAVRQAVTSHNASYCYNYAKESEMSDGPRGCLLQLLRQVSQNDEREAKCATLKPTQLLYEQRLGFCIEKTNQTEKTCTTILAEDIRDEQLHYYCSGQQTQ